MPNLVINLDAKDLASKDINKVAKNIKKLSKASGEAGKSSKGMTGSFLKANLALGAASAAFRVLSGAVKDSIRLSNEQAKQEAKLNAVLESTQHAAGLSAKQIKDMAAELQNMSTFGDEAILSGQNLLLTFTNISDEVFGRTSKAMVDMSTAMGQDMKSSAIQLGKALNDPMKGLSALSRVGVSFTDSQKEMIASLQESGDLVGAQGVLLEALETQFGGAAKAVADTFGGALSQLKNVQGDLLEDAGDFAAIFGTDIVKSMTESAKAAQTWLNSVEGIEKISNIAGTLAGTFDVLKQIASGLTDSFKGTFQKTIDKISKSFQEIFDEVGDGIDIFTILEGTVKGLGIAFSILGSVVAAAVKAIVRLGLTIKEVGELVTDFVGFLTGDVDAEQLKKQLFEVGDGFKKMGEGLVESVKDIVKTTREEFESLNSNGKLSARELEETFVTSYNKMKDKVKAANAEIKEDQKKTIEDLQTTGEGLGRNLAQEYEDYVTLKKKLDEGSITDFEEFKKAQVKLNEMGNDEMLKDYIKFQDSINAANKKAKNDWKGFTTGLVDAFTNSFNQIADAVNTIYDRMSQDIELQLERQITSIDEAAQRQLEILGLADETREEQLQNEITQKQEQIEQSKSMNEEQALQEELTTLEKELAKERILNNAEKRKEQARKASAKKQHQLEVEQFNFNKGASIANVWISTAQGIAAAWASSMSLGPIAGPIMAGIMTTLLTANAGVQTGVIASQQPPPAPFRNGGITGDGPIVVGEQGREILIPPAGSEILTNDTTERALGGFNIGSITVVANNPEEFKEALIELREQEQVS